MDRILQIFTLFLFGLVFALGLHLQHMEVPWFESEQHLLAYSIAKAIWDPSCTCDICRILQQHQILNPLRKARDEPHPHGY